MKKTARKKAAKKAGIVKSPAMRVGTTAPAATEPPKNTEVKITAAKGRPMLTWVGKRPLSHVTAFPAQHIETYASQLPSPLAGEGWGEGDLWKDLSAAYPKGQGRPQGRQAGRGDPGLHLAHDHQTTSAAAGLLQPKIDDWRAMVDCVMIDVAYDGKVFNVALSDVPEKKTDFVAGRYELPAPNGTATVAVRLIDMLGEAALVTLTA